MKDKLKTIKSLKLLTGFQGGKLDIHLCRHNFHNSYMRKRNVHLPSNRHVKMLV